MTDTRNRLLLRVIAPATEPLTLEETKLYLRVTDDTEDTHINDLIIAARMMAEQWLKRSLITQSWKIAYDDYVSESTALPMGPVQSVTSVTIVNKDTTTQVINSALYYLNAAKDTVMFQSDVLGFRVEIIYVTGYGDAQAVPRPIKQGMLSHIASMYDYHGEADGSAIPVQTLALYIAISWSDVMKKTTTSRLRQKLNLQKEIQTADTAGGYTRSWEDVSEVWADIESISSREKMMAMQVESEITHRLRLRARSGVDANQRLSGDGRVFYIRSVTPIEKNFVLELLVEERAGV